MKKTGSWRMLVGLHLHRQVRRVKRPESREAGREMRVRIPPLERSLRTAVSPFLVATTLSNDTANADGTTLGARNAGSNPAASARRRPTDVSSSGQDTGLCLINPSSPWTRSRWRMPDGLHRLLIARSRVRVPPGLPWARSSVGRAGTSVKYLVAMTD